MFLSACTTKKDSSVTVYQNTATVADYLDIQEFGVLEPPIISVQPKHGSILIKEKDYTYTATIRGIVPGTTSTLSKTVHSYVLTYTPQKDYLGKDSLTYKYKYSDKKKVKDQSVTVDINVIKKPETGSNHPPKALPQTVYIQQNTQKTIKLSGTDEDDDTLTYSKVSDPSHGKISSFEKGGTFLYIPTPNYSGKDSFRFKVNDGIVDSAPATVHIHIQSSTTTSTNTTPTSSSTTTTATTPLPRPTITQGAQHKIHRLPLHLQEVTSKMTH